MPGDPRIEALRRRLREDPSSMAFSVLAEEYRRAGHHAQAIETCRAGLARYPTNVSARITLGRALLEIDEPDLARSEIERVLRIAPHNVPAIRGLAELEYRCGRLIAAIELLRQALDLALPAPDLSDLAAALDRVGDAAAEPEPADAPVAASSPFRRLAEVTANLRGRQSARASVLGALERFLALVQLARAGASHTEYRLTWP